MNEARTILTVTVNEILYVQLASGIPPEGVNYRSAWWYASDQSPDTFTIWPPSQQLTITMANGISSSTILKIQLYPGSIFGNQVPLPSDSELLLWQTAPISSQQYPATTGSGLPPGWGIGPSNGLHLPTSGSSTYAMSANGDEPTFVVQYTRPTDVVH